MGWNGFRKDEEFVVVLLVGMEGVSHVSEKICTDHSEGE